MEKVCHLAFKKMFFEELKQYVSNHNKIEVLYNDVIKRYSNKLRFYHNLDHIYSMCFLWKKYKDKFDYPSEMFLAIVYHDIIYKVDRIDNEECSAEYFKKIALKKSFDIKFYRIIIVVDLIKSTKHSERKYYKMPEFNYLLDFDLNIFSSLEYDSYIHNIRNEYKRYSNFVYKKGRLDFLHDFLKRDIFLTKEFKKFENIAKKNIKSEINYLNL